MPFYKIMNGQLFTAENKVTAPDYTLTSDMPDKDSLPDGWIWRDESVENVNIEEIEATTGVPVSIDSWQGKRALINVGLYSAVESWVTASGDDTVKVMFNDAPKWHRDSTFIRVAQSVLNLTDAQVDELFKSAALINSEKVEQ